MEFSGQYLTYDEYEDLGGTLAEMPFNLLEFQARKQIDMRTQQRLIGINEIPNEVKLCDYYLIEKLNTYITAISTAESNGITSENIDGYSVSYNDATKIQEIIKSKQTEIDETIMVYLYGVIVNGEHAIYNGVK